MKTKVTLIAALLSGSAMAHEILTPPVSTHVTSSANSTSRSNASQHQSQSQTSNNMGGKSSSTVRNNTSVNAAPSTAQTLSNTTPRQVASAASLSMIPSAACAGTTGFGAQSGSFGVSFGTSWTAEQCMLLEQARMVAALGQPEVAQEMLCVIDNYREVRKAMGKPCIQRVKGSNPTAYQQEYTDPIIRARLGLPPLEQ